MSTQSNETFAAITTNSSSSAHSLPGNASVVDVYLDDASVWDTATMILESSVDGTNYIAVPGASWTSGLGFIARVSNVFGNYLRVTVSSVGGSTSLIATVTAVAVSGSFEQRVSLKAGVSINGTTDLVLPRGGAFAIFAAGTWDSASLTVDESPDGTLYVECVSAITSDGGAVYANTGVNTLLQLVVASAAGILSDLDLVILSV